MGQDTIHVRMLGTFSIEWRGRIIDDTGNRAR